MQKRSSLLCGAAIGVLLAAGIGADAQAKAGRHHHAEMAAGAETVTQEKIESLTAAVSTLENRLNDETAARQADEARAQAAEAKADVAEADAQATRSELQAQIQTIPGEVKSDVDAATPKPKPSWADGTKVGVTVFTDVSNISQTPTPNKINGTGVDIKRAYLIIDHQFSPIYSANLTIDFAPNGIILNGGTFGTGTLMGSEAIKYAYVQAKYADALIIQGGAEKTPWIPFVEDLYGYRYIDKVMIDQNKFGNSSDWGVNAHGDLGKGLFDYSVSVVDGAGYKNPDRSEQMDVEARANVNWMGFVLAGGGYWGKLSDDIQTAPPTTPPAPQTATRYDVLLAYTNSQIRAGVEYFNATDWKVVPKITPDQAEGWSAFASYNITPQWAVFGRYDGLEPSMKLARMERYDYYNIGISYEPVKTVDIALVYKHEDISHAPSGGYTDGTTTLAPTSTGVLHTSGDLNEFGIYTQFKF
jgi:hypothetical protein